VLYPVAVIKNTKNPAAARLFVRFIAGDTAARHILEKYGFAKP